MLSSRRSHRRPGGPELQRQQHWRGQLLRSADLNDHRDDEAERQHWHNRALHDAYGVTLGLTVRQIAGERPLLAVGPGLAYDAYGRELLLTAGETVEPPRGASDGGSWVLLLRRVEPLREVRTELVWRRRREAAVKDGVPLARGRWVHEGTRLVFEHDPAFRPVPARPMARPHLGEGSTPAGKTAWRSWEVRFDAFVHEFSMIARGIEVTVSTAAAGFTSTPCYFAWLQGGPWQVPHQRAATIPLDRIVNAERDRFTFSLWDPATSGPPFEGEIGDRIEQAAAELLELARERLFVCWLGVEPEPKRQLPGLQPPQLSIGKAGGQRPIRFAGGAARGPLSGPR